MRALSAEEIEACTGWRSSRMFQPNGEGGSGSAPAPTVVVSGTVPPPPNPPPVVSQSPSHAGGSGGGGSGGSSSSPPATFNVHVSYLGVQPAHQAAAQQAAANAVRALSKIDTALHTLDPNKVITWDGKSTTVGQVINTLENLNLQIVDPATYNPQNGGVGQASYSHNMDTIEYTALTGSQSYGSPNYSQDAGLLGIMMHELGHLNEGGSQFDVQDRNDFYLDPTMKGQQFTYSKYWNNTEAAANDFMNQISAITGLSIGPLSTDMQGGYGAKAPSAILAADGGHQ